MKYWYFYLVTLPLAENHCVRAFRKEGSRILLYLLKSKDGIRQLWGGRKGPDKFHLG